jgi:plastocyanin
VSRIFPLPFLTAALLLPFALAACGGDSGDRRAIAITQTDVGCSPDKIDLTTGEKVKFEVKNDGKKDREVEGIDGTKLEEVLVPSGKTRSVNYTAPGSPGTQKVKCYVPGGNTVLIELNVSAPAN